MSYSTVFQCANDQAFNSRVQACMVQQAWNNPEYHDTDFGLAVRQSPGYGVPAMAWPTAGASDVEAAYASALAASNPDPGGDETVITDAMILSNVQTNWPQDK